MGNANNCFNAEGIENSDKHESFVSKAPSVQSAKEKAKLVYGKLQKEGDHIKSVLATTLSLALLTNSSRLRHLYVFIQALKVTGFMSQLNAIWGEIKAIYERTQSAAEDEMSSLQANAASLKTAIPKQLRKLKEEVVTAKTVFEEEVRDLNLLLANKSISTAKFNEEKEAAIKRFQAVNSLFEGNKQTMNGIEKTLQSAWTSILHIVTAIEYTHLMQIFQVTFTAFMATIAVAKSSVLQSTTIGVNFGHILSERLDILVAGTSLKQNKWFLNLAHSACIGSGIYLGCFYNEMTVLSSIAMSGAENLLHSMTLTIFDPILHAIEVPKLSENPAILHALQVGVVSMAVFGQFNTMSSFVSIPWSNLIFEPYFFMDSYLEKLYSKY